MYYYILCSGSKGNCSVIGSKNTQIIIDCGSTVKYLKQCFSDINVDYKKADGILITHAHSDHVKQINMFKDLNVYSPFLISGIKNFNPVIPNEMFVIGDLTILPIPLSHDTDITVGYIIFDGEETLVQMTDTGYVSDSNLKLIRNANYYIFESNHDPAMLMDTDRPYMTKQRIMGDQGHLSNEDSALCLCKVVSEHTKEIALAHISQEANTYQLAYDTAQKALSAKGLMRDDLRLYALEQFKIYKGGSI